MTLNKTENIDEVKEMSNKVTKLNVVPLSQPLILPQDKYGPFCMKILRDFIEYHNIPKDIPLPIPGLLIHMSLSRIFDAIAYSMGKDKRDQILIELEEYKKNLKSIEILKH